MAIHINVWNTIKKSNIQINIINKIVMFRANRVLTRLSNSGSRNIMV